MGLSGIGVLVASQVLSVSAVLVFLGGVANMQQTLDNLKIIAGSAAQTQYANTFRGALLVDYSGFTGRQFGFQWWYWTYEVVLILWIFILCGVNIGIRHQCIPMTQSLLAVALSMGIYITNSSLFFYYSADAESLFGASAINALLSGAIILCVSNFVSIIALACAMPRPATYDEIVTDRPRRNITQQKQATPAV